MVVLLEGGLGGMLVGAETDIGVKRQVNEDNFWVSLMLENSVPTGVLCVCDGMGGLSNGEEASRIAVRCIRDALMKDFSTEYILENIRVANNRILSLSEENGVQMGTTCTLVVVQGRKYRVFHIGDSRCYLISRDVLNRITEDHTALNHFKNKPLSQELIKKYSSTLTRCLGVSKEPKVDVYSGTCLVGDLFVVCSDGFWHSLERGMPFKGSLKSMVGRCIEMNETDNITVATLAIKEGENNAK